MRERTLIMTLKEFQIEVFEVLKSKYNYIDQDEWNVSITHPCFSIYINYETEYEIYQKYEPKINISQFMKLKWIDHIDLKFEAYKIDFSKGNVYPVIKNKEDDEVYEDVMANHIVLPYTTDCVFELIFVPNQEFDGGQIGRYVSLHDMTNMAEMDDNQKIVERAFENIMMGDIRIEKSKVHEGTYLLGSDVPYSASLVKTGRFHMKAQEVLGPKYLYLIIDEDFVMLAEDTEENRLYLSGVLERGNYSMSKILYSVDNGIEREKVCC